MIIDIFIYFYIKDNYTINNMNSLLIVEDGNNTSYIDTLLIGLFYVPSHIHNYLQNNVKDDKIIYLQELIFDFIKKCRAGYCIEKNIVNEIRNYMIICGWKNNMWPTLSHTVQDLYEFIFTNIYDTEIKVEIRNNNNITNNYFKYLTFDITEDTSIKSLLLKWVEDNTQKSSTLSFSDVPIIIPILLNNPDQKNVDIKYQIKINTEKNSDNSWIIHSVICKDNNGYYTIFNTDISKWYIFRNNSFKNKNMPSIKEINITNIPISDKIKKQAVFVIYKFKF
jgi:hypothetical protein